MSAIHEQRTEDLRAYLMELSETCPVEPDNPDDCPLFALRKLKPAERVRWIRALKEDDLSYLATYHYICLDQRVEKQMAEISQ